jgi:peptidoglycan/xylan/chitin deacetylase (PgdA/CDA1 family)
MSNSNYNGYFETLNGYWQNPIPNNEPFHSLQDRLASKQQIYNNQPYQMDRNWEIQYPGSIFSQGPSYCKSVALTFDDGPDNLFSPVILEILAQYAVKATFFLNGNCVHDNPDITERIANEGHILANHTYNHPDLTTIPPEQIRVEIKTTQDEIQQITGLKTALFRPPYGALNNESIEVILSMGYKIILWNVDSLDWTGITGPAITARVVANTVPGSIILMHNACGGSIQAGTGTSQSLPYIIEILRAEGYNFTTIPALLNIPAYQ